MRNYNMPNYGRQSGNMQNRMEFQRCNMSNQMEYDACNEKADCLEMNYEPAMAYVPWQSFGALYEPEKSFEVGTMFVEMDRPFLGKGGMMRR